MMESWSERPSDRRPIFTCDSGVTLARRTIAQYREAEGIPPAYRRRLRVVKTRKRVAAPKASQD